jgi:predicted DNA-binding protein
MWTEVTKDLVIREAIDHMGYSCEETEDFFYVMEYLKYVRLDYSFMANNMLTLRRRTFCSL